MVGDSPQALIVNVSEAEAEMFFANRSAHGFNTLWVNLLCTTYTGGRPDGSTLDGILPFTGTLPSTGSLRSGDAERGLLRPRRPHPRPGGGPRAAGAARSRSRPAAG